MAMQFKTVTQMTQMTQRHADGLTWCMLRHDRWPLAGPPAGRSAGWPLAIPTMLEGGWVGPAAQGQQKRTDREQFFFLQNFYFLL